jgi:hypothetical protein
LITGVLWLKTFLTPADVKTIGYADQQCIYLKN